MKKAEAVKRMKMLRILPEVIKEFEGTGVVEVSERLNAQFPAVLYWATNDLYNNEISRLTDRIREFEEEFNALVYHVQLSHTEFGDLYSFFYVSDWPEEWEMDRELLEAGEAYTYVYNANSPHDSEIGMIGFKSVMGGVERTW